MTEPWPTLRVDEWSDTRDTLHMWTQIVGKIRMAQAPMLNHWWQVPLYVSPRGLTTSSIPHGDQLFDMEFDLLDHHLRVRSSRGEQRTIKLEPKSVASFYQEVTSALAELDLDVPIMASPVEIEHAIPFPEDTVHASYNPEHVRRFWAQLLATDRVLNQFRAHFIGKTSPVHFFWARWTWPARDSPEGPLRPTRAECRTAATGSWSRATHTS